MCRSFEDAGIKLNQGMGITEDLIDAHSLFLTANTKTLYVVLSIGVSEGPMVAGKTDIPAIRAIIEAEVHKMLSELSKSTVATEPDDSGL